MSVPPVVLNPASRREFLRGLFLTAGGVAAAPLLSACGSSRAPGGSLPSQAGGLSKFAGIGALQAPDANGIMLPQGFSSRVVAVSGETPVLGGSYSWHSFPDGGATYATDDGGWVYTSNSEVPGIGGLGGAGALRFDANGTVVDAYSIMTGTTQNCAGGKTPWGTWLSCEETGSGITWECDPLGVMPAVAKPALGTFAHEAVAVDETNRELFLTEDTGDGAFYRFVPSATDWPAGSERAAMEDGVLQVARVLQSDPDDVLYGPQPVVWLDAINPDQPQSSNRHPEATPFAGGEGIWWYQGVVFFSTKGDNRIWAYDTHAQTLEVIYDFATSDNPILSGVDNLLVSSDGDVLVAEDGGNMEICVILPDRTVKPVLRITGQDASEICGPAFSPDGTRLYLSSQRGGRGGAGSGITYEIGLPFVA